MNKEITMIELMEKDEELVKAVANWLAKYTQKVYERVRNTFDEIAKNETAIELIKELYIREKVEIENYTKNLFWDIKMGQTSILNFDVLTKAKSFRDVLYALYISPLFANE